MGGRGDVEGEGQVGGDEGLGEGHELLRGRQLRLPLGEPVGLLLLFPHLCRYYSPDRFGRSACVEKTIVFFFLMDGLWLPLER